MLAQLIYEYNEAYNGILGYRRMTLYINILNQTNYSEKYIHRLMKVIGIRARIRRKKSNYIKSEERNQITLNQGQNKLDKTYYIENLKHYGLIKNGVQTLLNLKFQVRNKNYIYQPF